MKAVQIQQCGDFDVLAVAELAKPVAGPGQVVVKNEYAGINFIDTYQRSGLYPVQLPAILGREGAGVVESVGPEVSAIKVGDRVAYVGPESHAEYTKVNQNFVYVIPNNVTTETACAAMLQGLTAVSMAKYSYPVKKGDFVLIHAAAGGTGSLLVQVCKNYGATVIGTTSSPEKETIAKSLGTDYVILYTSESVVDRVMQITGGNGVKAVFDGVGKATWEDSLNCLARRGYFVSFGNASGKVPPIEPLQLRKNTYLTRPSLFESISSSQEFQDLCDELFSMISKGALKLKIHKHYKLEEDAAAQKDLTGRTTTGKLLIKL